jgi:putative transposase
MGDVSVFMRELKQRFAIWYNHKHRNQGTIWSDRFKSVIVEPSREAMSKVAAYIDLNPVRAELVRTLRNTASAATQRRLVVRRKPAGGMS